MNEAEAQPPRAGKRFPRRDLPAGDRGDPHDRAAGLHPNGAGHSLQGLTRLKSAFCCWSPACSAACGDQPGGEPDRDRAGLPLAGCGKSLPPQDAAIGDPQKPRLFGVSPKWKKAMDGFFHGQLDPGGSPVCSADVRGRLLLVGGASVFCGSSGSGLARLSFRFSSAAGGAG